MNRPLPRLLAAGLLLLGLCLACTIPGQDDPFEGIDPQPSAPASAPAPTPTPTPTPGAPTAPPAPGTPPTTAGAPPVFSLEEQRGRKIQDVVRYCINRFTERAMRSRQRYLQWCDPERGPTGNERYITYGLYTLTGDPARCRRAVNEMATLPPSMPELEQAAARYASAVEALHPLLEEAHNYYDRESYRDDGAARGQELHPRLMAGWEELEAASDALRGQVRAIEGAARDARLARMEADPALRTSFLIERVMAEAQQVADVVQSLELRDRRLVAEDPAAFERLVLQFQQHADELRVHQPIAPDRAPRFGYDIFRSQVEDVVQVALGVMRRARDGTPFGRTELRRLGTSAGWMTDDSPDNFVREYNRLIDRYNSLR